MEIYVSKKLSHKTQGDKMAKKKVWETVGYVQHHISVGSVSSEHRENMKALQNSDGKG